MLQYFGRYVLAAPEVSCRDSLTGPRNIAKIKEHLLETFYTNLGAQPLSSLIKTEHLLGHVSSTPSSQATAQRKHVLERLTIFLAEARRKQSDYSAEWLSKEGNFDLLEVRDLKARYTYRNGRHEYHHTEVSVSSYLIGMLEIDKQTLYATASTRPRSKAILLTVSLTAQPDDYE